MHARLFGIGLPVPLEVANDAKATVDVVGCEKILGEDFIALEVVGDGVASAPSYRKVTAQSHDGWAEADARDYIAVVPQDPSLGGQVGYLRVKFRYHFESNGWAQEDTPTVAMAGLWPVNEFGSSFASFHDGRAEPQVVEETIELDVYIHFSTETSSYLTSTPIHLYVRTRPSGGTAKAEAEWLGIVSVLDENKVPVVVDFICTASGEPTTAEVRRQQ